MAAMWVDQKGSLKVDLMVERSVMMKETKLVASMVADLALLSVVQWEIQMVVVTAD